MTELDVTSIKISLFVLWEAIEMGTYDTRSIVGDQVLNIRDTIYSDEKQFWKEYRAHLRSQARSECGQEN